MISKKLNRKIKQFICKKKISDSDHENMGSKVKFQYSKSLLYENIFKIMKLGLRWLFSSLPTFVSGEVELCYGGNLISSK